MGNPPAAYVVTAAAYSAACRLPYLTPIKTGREGSQQARRSGEGAAAAQARAATGATAAAGSGLNNSNYQIAAHIPENYVLSSPELYESPSAVTRAYQRNIHTTPSGVCRCLRDVTNSRSTLEPQVVGLQRLVLDTSFL